MRSGSAGRGIEFLRPVAMAPTLCGTAGQSLISLTQSLRHQRTSAIKPSKSPSDRKVAVATDKYGLSNMSENRSIAPPPLQASLTGAGSGKLAFPVLVPVLLVWMKLKITLSEKTPTVLLVHANY